MGKYVHHFTNDSEFINAISAHYLEPWVSLTEQENRVDYNQNTKSFSIFKKVFCDNINETDREMFKNGIVTVTTDIWKGNLGYGEPETYNVNIKFSTNNILGELDCNVSPIVITEEQYNQWKDLGGDELLSMILPLFQCQGEAEHTWDRPGSPT